MATLTPAQRHVVDQLLQTEWPKLERFFRTKVAPDQVQDLAQATVLKYVEALDRVTSPRGFLWGIARNLVLQHWASHRGNTPFDSATHSVLEVGPSLSSVVDRRNRLLRSLQSLPADHQTVVELRHGEELTIDEIAVAMELSPATVKRYLAAAEVQLRQQLGGEAEHVVQAYREN